MTIEFHSTKPAPLELDDTLLHTLVPNATDAAIHTFLDPLNAAMQEFRIADFPLRIAAFLAQIAHESGSFRYVEEIASGSAYEKRKDLGNTQPEAIKAAKAKGTTPGRFYRGHGLIQITGYFNHKACGEALGLDLVNNPKLLTKPIHAARSAAWFWKTHGLNELADKKDFREITRKINGGYNGYAERVAWYEICKNELQCNA